jgi:PAS domain S-box-containing protein
VPKKTPKAAAGPAPAPAPAYGLSLFNSLLEILEQPSDASRRRYYRALLGQAMAELGVEEGSLILATPLDGGFELKLACVNGLASEIWAGERATAGDSASGQAARTLKPVRRSEYFGELLCVPVLHRGELQGVLALNRPEGEAFPKEAVEKAEGAAAGLGAALWASQALHSQAEAGRQLAALIAAGTAVIRGRKLSDVLERVIRETQELMQAEAASVFLVDEESGELVSQVATGPSQEGLAQLRLAPGEGVAGWVAQHGEAQLIRHAEDDPRFAARVDKKTRFKTRDLACVPMRVEGHTLGVLEVLNKKGGERFQARELPILQAMANLAAVAVESGRLYDQMQERAGSLNTELIQANSETGEVKTRLESVLFAMEDGVVAADENGRVTLMNRAAQIISFGLSHQEPQGRPLGELIPKPEFAEKLGEVRMSGRNAVLELELEAPEARTFAIVITPIKDLEGYLTGFVVVLRDVTRFKELERMKIAFLNTVSHELRTPMTSIRAFSELLVKRQSGPEKTAEWAGVIFEEARRLGRLIDDLLDVSRIEAGKRLSVNKAMSPLLPVFIKAARLFEKDAEKHPITLHIDEGLEEAEFDPDRMEQILANLLSNAIKYSPLGGEVALRASFREPDLLRVEVRDSGIGLSEVDKAHLFEKFYRAESKENVGIGGTGLGLSITKYLVEQHGGRVGVDSQLGEGSAFWFEFPILSAKDARA